MAFVPYQNMGLHLLLHSVCVSFTMGQTVNSLTTWGVSKPISFPFKVEDKIKVIVLSQPIWEFKKNRNSEESEPLHIREIINEGKSELRSRSTHLETRLVPCGDDQLLDQQSI